MRLSHGSQTFRRDSEGLLGRGEGPNESEPFLFQQGENDHDHPAEELSVHRIQVLARRCAFPFARRIPRVTKRRTGQVLLILWLCWIVAACIEWRAQHNLRRSRKQLVAFLQETTFYVVEEGRLSESWQSPLQRRLTPHADGEPVVGGEAKHGEEDSDRQGHSSNSSPVGVDRDLGRIRGGFASAGYGDSEEMPSGGFSGGSQASRQHREPADEWLRQRRLRSQASAEGHESCPLIYTVDAKTAKKHGLLLFQEELELLGTVTARLCRCLCHSPLTHTQDHPQGQRRTAFAAASDSGHKSAEAERPHRRLGVCEGEAHALMLEEMLKGANVVISGDSGWFYRWFESMQDAYARTCSHFSTRSTLGIPEGTVLRTVLTGTDMYEDSWFQLEGAAWRPFRHPIDAVRHGFNFMQYKLRQSQVGPLGKSTHTDLHPMMVTFDGCVSVNDAQSAGDDYRHGGRLLIVPEDV
ncbi:unnamed protein product [Ectocarpus sp. 12 AP-2014]